MLAEYPGELRYTILSAGINEASIRQDILISLSCSRQINRIIWSAESVHGGARFVSMLCCNLAFYQNTLIINTLINKLNRSILEGHLGWCQSFGRCTWTPWIEENEDWFIIVENLVNKIAPVQQMGEDLESPFANGCTDRYGHLKEI